MKTQGTFRGFKRGFREFQEDFEWHQGVTEHSEISLGGFETGFWRESYLDYPYSREFLDTVQVAFRSITNHLAMYVVDVWFHLWHLQQ